MRQCNHRLHLLKLIVHHVSTWHIYFRHGTSSMKSVDAVYLKFPLYLLLFGPCLCILLAIIQDDDLPWSIKLYSNIEFANCNLTLWHNFGSWLRVTKYFRRKTVLAIKLFIGLKTKRDENQARAKVCLEEKIRLSTITPRVPSSKGTDAMAASSSLSSAGETQQYALKWNDFHTNILSTFRNLRDEEDFVDVTLACDNCSFTAHKVVLSACSPYFRQLLKVSVDLFFF